MSNQPIRIERVSGPAMPAQILAQVDGIFLETAIRPPAPGPEREAFRERWLGRYLANPTDVVLLAMTGEETVVGYLVGALGNPAMQPRFDDISYFRTDFADLCRRFPAHLHINITASHRNRGVGAQLIEAFAAIATRAGAPGMHIVTGRGMRNVRFYARCGFQELGAAKRNGGAAVFLGRKLPDDHR